MGKGQAEFLSRLNIENFKRQLMGDLTDAQRATVLALLVEAEAQAVNIGQNTAPLADGPERTLFPGPQGS
jgi:hypothetical protein